MRISGRVVTLAAMLALVLAGCSGGTPNLRPSPSASRPVVLRSLPTGAPGCSTATATAPRLPAGLVRLSPVPGNPFGVAVTASGHWSFVSMLGGGPTGGGIGVFADTGSASPRLVRQIPLADALGVALSADGRYLLAAQDSGAAMISVQAAEQGGRNALLGTLRSQSGRPAALGGGAIEMALSPDGRFAFVSLEYAHQIAVFDLQRAMASHFHTSGFVGDVPTGIAPVGLAVSPDGKWLYSTSELSAQRARQRGSLGGTGTLSVINLRQAETDPGHAVVSTVDAGCSPVRVVTSADGTTVWVTARGSDMLLGFSAAALRADPAHSLVARVEVGEAPVGLAMVDGGQRVVIADSNRFGQHGASANLAVVNVPAALAHAPALAGYLPAGGFPRQMALEPGGRTLLVTNFDSRQLETVNVTNLP